MSYSLKEAIRQVILADPDIAALIGERLTSAFAPLSGTASGPWVVMTQISGQEDGSFDGDAGLTRPRFQFTIGGPAQETVDQVRDALIRNFNAAVKLYTDGDSVERRITFFHADDNEAWEEPTRSYKVLVDFFIWANR
jgi:hypothetical protein